MATKAQQELEKAKAAALAGQGTGSGAEGSDNGGQVDTVKQNEDGTNKLTAPFLTATSLNGETTKDTDLSKDPVIGEVASGAPEKPGFVPVTPTIYVQKPERDWGEGKVDLQTAVNLSQQNDAEIRAGRNTTREAVIKALDDGLKDPIDRPKHR